MAILPPDPVFLLRGHDAGPIHSLLFRVSPYVEHLYAGAESGTVHIWDLRVKIVLLCIDNIQFTREN